jgi:glycosidase
LLKFIIPRNTEIISKQVQLYDTLRFLTTGQRSTADISEIQKNLSGINQHMLHFIENHDEQRAASKYFAGDPWKAAPAMVVSATIDRGAVMIYFGQEVGEPGLGAEGFQGDDGRTTIFDYWGMPEHQKWMNGGKFNGDSLSGEQKQLRQFYIDLLNLAANRPALKSGGYADITLHNIQAGNFNDKVLAYVRYEGDERLLILASFNDTAQPIKVQIPKDVAQQMGLDSADGYIARDLLWREVEVGVNDQLIFELNLKPYSSYVFKIK